MNVAVYGEELTERETKALCLVADGIALEDIAKQFKVARSTVKTDLDHARVKLGARDRANAVYIALRQGLIPKEAPDV